MIVPRQVKIEDYAGNGQLKELKELLEPNHNQMELDVALEMAIAYSKIEVAKYLVSLGADFANYEYQGTYYAVHNNELKGLQFAIENGVDVNVNEGSLINTAIVTAFNSKDVSTLDWLLDNGADPKLIKKGILKAFSSEEIAKTIKRHTKNLKPNR